jgi:hypothetical protein
MPPVGLIKDIARRLCGGEILKRIVDDYRGTPYKVTQPSAAVLKQSLKQDGGDTRLRVLAYNLWCVHVCLEAGMYACVCDEYSK